MPKKSPHPHVAWRDGRPRFVPGRELRAEGHKGRDLTHEDGSWYSFGEACDWARQFARQLESHREQAATAARASSRAPAGAKARSADSARTKYLTVAQLLEDWQSPERGGLRFRAEARNPYPPATRRFYRQHASVIAADHVVIWNAPVDFLKPGDLVAMYEEIYTARGLATARAVIRTLSAAISWAIRKGRVKRETNPCRGLGMETPAPRLRVATRVEFDALVAAADGIGRPEIGDMCFLAVWTGQRQADRIALVERGLVSGRRVFRQAKTGAVVAIRDTPHLARRLKAAQARRAAARAAALIKARDSERPAIETRFAHAVLDERTWQPFGEWHYRKTFAKIRAAAVKQCASLADFTDQDFRDTAVTWMANAGATIPEICAVTGHTLESATRILKHYLAINPEMADQAIGKMLAMYDGQIA